MRIWGNHASNMQRTHESRGRRQPEAQEKQSTERPESHWQRHDNNSNAPVGGLDSKTQFLANQGLNSSAAKDKSGSSNQGVAVKQSDNEYFNYKQGRTGDCAVLSAISSVASDADGKAILDESVKANGDGSYTVSLKGTGETFQISKAEMNDGKLSSGEPKVKALENAIKKHYAKKGDNFEGKGGPDVIKLLTGKQTTSLKDGNNPAKLKANLLKLAKEDKDGLTLEVGAQTLTGSKTKGMHGYAVTNINEQNNTISYTNPWNASDVVTVNLDDFVRDLTAQGSGGVDYVEV